VAEVRIGVNVDATGAVKSFKLISTGAKDAGKDAGAEGAGDCGPCHGQKPTLRPKLKPRGIGKFP